MLMPRLINVPTKFYLLWEAEFTIAVRVKEFNETLALNEAGAEVVVVLQEVCDLVSLNVTSGVTVKSLES